MAQNQEKKATKKPSSNKKAPSKANAAYKTKPNHTSKKTVAKKGSPVQPAEKVQNKSKSAPKSKLRVIPLGGLQEIGKNMTVLEYGQDIIVIDCGVAFPDDDLLGVELVIPDTSYLEQNEHRIRGIFRFH